MQKCIFLEKIKSTKFQKFNLHGTIVMASKCSHNGWHTGPSKGSFRPLGLSIVFGRLGHGRKAQFEFGQPPLFYQYIVVFS
jgi:hypothetical protein